MQQQLIGQAFNFANPNAAARGVGNVEQGNLEAGTAALDRVGQLGDPTAQIAAQTASLQAGSVAPECEAMHHAMAT